MPFPNNNHNQLNSNIVDPCLVAIIWVSRTTLKRYRLTKDSNLKHFLSVEVGMSHDLNSTRQLKPKWNGVFCCAPRRGAAAQSGADRGQLLQPPAECLPEGGGEKGPGRGVSAHPLRSVRTPRDRQDHHPHRGHPAGAIHMSHVVAACSHLEEHYYPKRFLQSRVRTVSK